MALATVADVAARWPPGLHRPDDATVQTWLDDADAVLWAAYPTLDDLIADGTDAERALVVLVECRMVIRVLSNPRGVVREAVGDTSVSYVTDAMGTLALHDDDRALLDPLFGIRAGLVSVPLARADLVRAPWPWLESDEDEEP